MINIIIKTTNITPTPALDTYIKVQVDSLGKILQGLSVATEARVEVGRSTFHHKKGEVFFAEINLVINSNILRAKSESFSVKAALDDVKDELRNAIYKFKGKKTTLFLRGARSVGKFFRMSPLARFRPKYRRKF